MIIMPIDTRALGTVSGKELLTIIASVMFAFYVIMTVSYWAAFASWDFGHAPTLVEVFLAQFNWFAALMHRIY